MPTVSYLHQPGIQRSRGNVPLAGTSHVYTVSKVLWPESVRDVLADLLIGRSLHVCSGISQLGTVRLDRFAEGVNVRADAACLPFSDYSFDTVLCDPPYNGVFQWNHDLLSELSRVAVQRIVFQHWFLPATPQGRYKKAQERFGLTHTYVWQPRTYFGRAQVISVFDATSNKEAA
jgi:hypothetical protein